MKIKNILFQIFSDGETLSSKRIFGAIGFVAFIVLLILNYDNDSIKTLGYIASALLGLGTLETIMSNFKK